MPRTVTSTLLFALFFSWGIAGLGVLSAQSHTYVFNQLNASNGLSSPQYNYYVHQDQEGFVWISSTGGLFQFNGQQVKEYAPQTDRDDALHTGYVSMSPFYDGADKSLWFTENTALIRYNREQDNFQRYQVQHPNDTILLRSGYSWCYVDTLLDRIWFSVNDYLFSGSLAQPQDASLVKEIPLNIESQMYKCTTGQFWLLSFGESGISQCFFTKKGKLLRDTVFSAPYDVNIQELLPANDSLIWVGTDKGLYTYQPLNGQWTLLPLEWQGVPLTNISEIVQRENGELLLGIDGQGVYFFDPADERIDGQLNQLKQDEISVFVPFQEHRLNIDREENVWISTDDEGLFFTNLDQLKFERFGTIRETIYALEEKEQKELLAVVGHGMYRLRDNQTPLFYPFPGDAANHARPLFCFVDEEDNTWVGTLSDLYILEKDGQAFKSFDKVPRAKDGFSSGYSTMCQLPNQDYLIGTTFGSVIQLKANRQSYQMLKTDDDLSPIVSCYDPFVFTYSLGNNDTFRIYRYEQERLSLDTLLTSLLDVSTILTNDQHLFWLATSHGLYQLELSRNGQWELQQDTIFSARKINSMLLTPAGELWLGTTTGLRQYKPANASYLKYSTSDGLQALQFIERAAIVASDGTFVFGTTKGINRFVPQEVTTESLPARPVISNILINFTEDLAHRYSNDSIQNPAYIKRLELPYSHNSLEFELAARSYGQGNDCL
ncbi:MAG: hypothetical protein AAGJ93_05645, partial [Bacteroidota bacterium]